MIDGTQTQAYSLHEFVGNVKTDKNSNNIKLFYKYETSRNSDVTNDLLIKQPIFFIHNLMCVITAIKGKRLRLT